MQLGTTSNAKWEVCLADILVWLLEPSNSSTLLHLRCRKNQNKKQTRFILKAWKVIFQDKKFETFQIISGGKV